MGIDIDIADNIPSNPPASGPPTATLRTNPAASRAPPAAMERAEAEHPGWAESAKIHDFLKILKNHDFHRKIKVAKSIGGRF